MREAREQLLPRARKDELIVRELPDELLVYDLRRNKAHCLNKASAFVWRHCDGKRTVAELTRLLEREYAALIEDDVVRLALNQLRRFHLLEEEGKINVGFKVTRRDLVRKYLPAALTLPVILSIPAPTAAQAASRPCSDVGGPCVVRADCCPPLFCGAGRCQAG